MVGTCGTCGRDAQANAENEGYSGCCNDRIEYGDEAALTKRRCWREAKALQLYDAMRAKGVEHDLASMASEQLERRLEAADGIEPEPVW